jgi:hypothetical protein
LVVEHIAAFVELAQLRRQRLADVVRVNLMQARARRRIGDLFQHVEQTARAIGEAHDTPCASSVPPVQRCARARTARPVPSLSGFSTYRVTAKRLFTSKEGFSVVALTR